MLAPGATLSAAGRLFATIGLGTTADFISGGVGFKNNGSVALDTSAPAGNVFDGGIAQNASGAFYAKITQAGTDIFNSGLRCSVLGQIIIESADAASFSNGNGITAAGNLAVN